mgnify:CR=1 FL=1
MPTIDQLKWSWLTGAINEIKSPNQFLKRLLFPNRVTLPTEDIEISQLSRGRETAPFVVKNGEGIMVGGHNESFQTIQAPNIRIKKPFTPSELLYTRRPGNTIFLNNDPSQQVTALEQHILRDTQGMADMITNAEEWLCAQALTGTISYSVNGQDSFQVTSPRSGSTFLDVSGTAPWGTSNSRPLQDTHSVKKVMSDEVGLQPNIAICGKTASEKLLEMAEADLLPAFKTDSGVSAGTISFVEQFGEDGAIFLGTMGGIQFWEYSRTVEQNGSSVDLIEPKDIHFVSTSPASERVLYYAAIPDMRAIEGQVFQGERFMKSWEVEDPSAMMSLAASRPLPVLRRADAIVTLTVAA